MLCNVSCVCFEQGLQAKGGVRQSRRMVTGDVSRGAPRKQKGKKHSHVWCAGAHLVLCFQNGGRVAQPRPAVHHVRLGWPMRAPAQHRSTLHSTNMSMGQEAVVMSCTSAATLQPGPFSELGGGTLHFVRYQPLVASHSHVRAQPKSDATGWPMLHSVHRPQQHTHKAPGSWHTTATRTRTGSRDAPALRGRW